MTAFCLEAAYVIVTDEFFKGFIRLAPDFICRLVTVVARAVVPCIHSC
jgi:hypothetical protein